MTRGILSIYWGDESKLPIQRLRASVKKFHPELPHEIVKINASPEDISSLNQKAKMFDLSPFGETLFLDIDTVVLGRLDFGFKKAQQFGLAVSICESPWARRYPKIFSGDEIEYNTGVIFFNRDSKVVFDCWKELSTTIDSSILAVNEQGVGTMPANDQGSFALAIEQTRFNPFVLPLNWNFRPQWYRSFFGPIKIWHDYSNPPLSFSELNAYYSNSDSIIQYHQG
ncbi:hypothetical protein [Polynucleobacter sp. MWH-UH23A]|uniref:hypothetical protein n=1 Tax=Polynucleobacter sp. MWH-UH23A TaxID=1855613 RepID=UPI0033651D36